MFANVVTVTGCALTAALLLTSVANAGPMLRYRGMSLEKAIEALEQRGLVVVYSSSLVKPWMRIHTEPGEGTPQEVLTEILAPFGLHARVTARGAIAIVRGRRDSPVARDVRLAPAPAPAQPHRTGPPLEEVVVAASQYELTRGMAEPRVSLSGTDIEQIPDLGDDSIRAAAYVPGIATNGLSARSHIRGGEAGETLVRLDGQRLYNPFHLKDFHSIFSVVDPRIVSTVDVYTGGFAARFGDRLSGVIDIASLEPPAPRYREVNVSFFNTSALTSGQFRGGDGEWVVSARRSNLDVWYHALRDTPGTPTYQDAFGKLSLHVSPRLRLTASTLYAADEIGLSIDDDEERANADYRDLYHWLRADHRASDTLKGVTLLSHTRLRASRDGIVDQDGVSHGTLRDWRSTTFDSLTTHWTWQGGEAWLVEFGGELRRARGTYDFQESVAFDVLLDAPGAHRSTFRDRAIRVNATRTDEALHASLRTSITPRLTADIGLRWESRRAGPRVGVRYELGPRTFVRANAGRLHQSQGIDELQVTDGIVDLLPPQPMEYGALGMEHAFENGVDLRVEAYEKRLRHPHPRYENLVNTLTLIPELHPDRVLIAPSRARARGMEILASRGGEGPWSWWLAYSWSSTRERLDGRDTLRSWDQKHAVSAGLTWRWRDWTAGAALIHRSGWPTTQVYLEEDGEVPVLGIRSRNETRVPAYRSLDVRIERRFTLERSTASVFLELANVLGRDNICCSSYEIDDETGGLELERRNYLPRIPSLGLLWQF